MKRNNCAPWRKLHKKTNRERQRIYWRRWKENNAPKEISRFGWKAVFSRKTEGWVWKAKKTKNGAVLSNGPFESMGLAKKDFYEAVRE